jgi:hypothetical protein
LLTPIIAGPERAGDFRFGQHRPAVCERSAGEALGILTMDDISLRADCAQCAALCCVALAFDRSALFALDKPAGVACPNLRGCNTCAIHEDLAGQGFAGCVRFDCLGAGQRVTQMFAGQSWRDDPQTARAMFDAFRVMRPVHELIQLLHEAGKLAMSREQAGERVRLLRVLQQRWSVRALLAFERGPVAGEVRAFLASLRECVGARGR